MDIVNFTKDELKQVIKDLKFYKSFHKSVGKRAKLLFDFYLNGKKITKVEYFSGVNKDETRDMVLSMYQNFFKEKVDPGNIKWIENDTIKGGVRIFLGDDMVNVSFEEMENRIIKN